MRRALFLSIPLALWSAACSYDNGNARRVHVSQDPGVAGSDNNGPPGAGSDAGGSSETPPCDGAATPVQTWIDVGAQIETRPGEGAGLFVEYAAGGHWHLRTSCDISKDNPPCAWDIIVTPEDGRSISNVAPADLEAGTDSVKAYPEDLRSYQLIAETSDDLDGMTFDTQPGTAILVDVFLDGKCALPYFFWVGDGAAHVGSPSNPLVLIPTAE